MDKQDSGPNRDTKAAFQSVRANQAEQAPAALWLASQSPRRSAILTQMGVKHQIISPPDAQVAQVAEALEAVLPEELPESYVQRVALAKLRYVLAQRQPKQSEVAILCADTTVALEHAIFGKPANEKEAFSMLQALSGKPHWVYTALALSYQNTVYKAFNASRVYFAPMPAHAITAYIATGEPFGKAGAYALQGQGANWVERIEGSESGIRGLPTFETAGLLRCIGYNI